MVYSPGQFEQVIPHLPREPKWLILGGPADANEAQTARTKWPDIKVIGVEPNPEARDWQLSNGWPENSFLLPYALSDKNGFTEMVYAVGGLRNARIDTVALELNRIKPEATFLTVPTITLDMLESAHGPFEDAILWLDIECSEYPALLGGAKLLASGRVLLLNIEEMIDSCPDTPKIQPLLNGYGYKIVHEWNVSTTCRDRVYVLQS